MSAPDLAALVEAYRKASQEELRTELLPGKRAADRRWKLMNRRTEIDTQLHALGEHDLRGSLVSEHVSGRNIIAHLTGQPLDGPRPFDLAEATQNLVYHRGRIAERLASVSRGTVTP